MLSLRRWHKLPRNFSAFVEELACGIEGLYGAASAEEYRRRARDLFGAAVESTAVDVVGLFDGPDAAGVLMAASRDNTGEITLVHVLEHYLRQGVEERLVAESVRMLRESGAKRILSEFVPLYAEDLGTTFGSLGFESVERAVMAAAASAPGLAPWGLPESVPITEADRGDAAEVIIAAYEGHPDRKLHSDVGDTAAARAFLERVADGGFGLARRSFSRLIRKSGQCAGVIAGCEIGPDIGFILQVAVAPAFQGKGLGTRLLREQAVAFRETGMARIALGVTMDNPARELYERLGFAVLRPVRAHVWQALL